ncbi:uncharacterized protein PV06_10304 [Exophiala oligosperma]|uniref:G-patch domain-containing protein n=2 Tax=Chaetothyriales TaxID=34395 RepID=A0A0D2D5K8_9EURO|nr:uncharacterized protein PV06_10304 [Exophiala oligosperma]KAJ9623809.1 hypothetical protein H2204_011101 [Knufia peltigerae]KIW37665.1 hypothetical protein PV06_10304 [Exophiala oligosperma]
MDAHAHLLSLGWAGPGHSLDSRPYKQKGHRGLAYDPAKVGNNGTGLVKPLLVSQRKGRLGVGKKSHEPQAGNEWWLKGFESALGNIGKSESERSSGASTPAPALDNTGGKHGGLYSFFVKGQQMQGTIGLEEEGDAPSSSRTDDRKKRKSDHFWSGATTDGDVDGQGDSTVKNKRQKRSAAAEFEQVGEYLALRDQDGKRRKRTERPGPVEEFRQVGEYLAARTDKKRKNKDKLESQENEGSGASTPALLPEQDERTETQEERRERRRKRKEEKERRQKRQMDGQGGGGRSEDVEISSEDAAAKEARRAERKRRKAAEKAGKVAKS